MRRYLVAAVAIALTLAACGSSSKSSKSTSQTSQSATGSGSQSSTAASGTLVATASTSLGQTLVDANGMTLYRFDKDTGSTSVCTATCASTWPPFTAPSGMTAAPSVAGVSDLALVARSDGAMQVTHQGHPLYRFSGDTKAGDTNGNGFGGVWHVELASGPAPAAAASSTPTTAKATATTVSNSYYP